MHDQKWQLISHFNARFMLWYERLL